MKIKLLGINLLTGKGITLADLFSSIGRKNGEPLEVGGHGRFMYINTIDGYHVGLLITTKDHNKYLEFKRNLNTFKLETKDISEGSKLADFNFFAINIKTGRGIYQYYHQSCSLRTFGILCRTHYEKLKELKINEIVEKKLLSEKLSREDDISKFKTKEEKNARKDFAGTLRWEAVVRPERFEQLVSKLQSVASIKLSIATTSYDETAFTRLAKKAKSTTQIYNFANQTRGSTLIRPLKEIFKNADVRSAKVTGMNLEGLDDIIKLANTPDQFGEYEFDDIASTMTIAPSDFINSKLLSDMIEIAKTNIALKE